MRIGSDDITRLTAIPILYRYVISKKYPDTHFRSHATTLLKLFTTRMSAGNKSRHYFTPNCIIWLDICIHRGSILLRSFVPICHFITIFSMHTIWHWKHLEFQTLPSRLSTNIYRSSLFALKDGRKPLMFTSALPAKIAPDDCLQRSIIWNQNSVKGWRWFFHFKIASY